MNWDDDLFLPSHQNTTSLLILRPLDWNGTVILLSWVSNSLTHSVICELVSFHECMNQFFVRSLRFLYMCIYLTICFSREHVHSPPSLLFPQCLMVTEHKSYNEEDCKEVNSWLQKEDWAWQWYSPGEELQEKITHLWNKNLIESNCRLTELSYSFSSQNWATYWTNTYVHQRIYTKTFVAALCLRIQIWKKLKCPCTEWLSCVNARNRLQSKKGNLVMDVPYMGTLSNRMTSREHQDEKVHAFWLHLRKLKNRASWSPVTKKRD